MFKLYKEIMFKDIKKLFSHLFYVQTPLIYITGRHKEYLIPLSPKQSQYKVNKDEYGKINSNIHQNVTD